jgi:hypothetical protein
MPSDSSIANVDEAGSLARPSGSTQTIRRAAELEFIPQRLAYRLAADVAYPNDGELLLWRCRSEWHFVSKDAAYARLSQAELARVKSHPNPALGKRFVVGRAAMREILGDMIGCAPAEVDLVEDAQGQLRVANVGEREPIEIAIAYAGIWIVIGVSKSPLGLATSVPTLPDNAPSGHPDGDTASSRRQKMSRSIETRSHVRHASLTYAMGAQLMNVDAHVLQQDAATFFVDAPDARRWQIIDLPMPGIISAAAAVAQPVTRVHAFGWMGRDGRAIAE